MDKRGALYKLGKKRGLLALLILMFMIAAVYLSGLISAGVAGIDTTNAIDTGLDKSYGVKLDLVENGLTHKVLEMDFGSARALGSEDLAMLVTDTDFDSASITNKLLEVRREREVSREIRENVCNPYSQSFENGSIMDVQNCTSVVTGSYNEMEAYWEPVSLVGTDSLDTAGSVTGQVFRYSFDVPIVKRDDGTYGSAGKVYVNAKGSTFVDLQHSSWWNLSCSHKTSIHIAPQITDSNMQLKLSLLTNGSNWNDRVYVVDNRTETTLKWINFTDFGISVPTEIWTNTSVTANTNFGIDIYYNCSSNTPQYSIEDIFLLARGYNSQASIDDNDGSAETATSSTTYKNERNASMLMSAGVSQVQRVYNLTKRLGEGGNIMDCTPLFRQ